MNNCVTSASCSASKNLEDGHCGPGACEDVFVQPTIQRGPQLVHLQKRGGNTGLCERKHRLRTSGRRHSRKLSMRKQAVVGLSKGKQVSLGKILRVYMIGLLKKNNILQNTHWPTSIPGTSIHTRTYPLHMCARANTNPNKTPHTQTHTRYTHTCTNVAGVSADASRASGASLWQKRDTRSNTRAPPGGSNAMGEPAAHTSTSDSMRGEPERRKGYLHREGNKHT